MSDRYSFSGPAWLNNMPKEVAKLVNGESIVVGNKIYTICDNCRHVVQVNKPFVGSAHFCS